MGEYDCAAKAMPGEPTFTLLARDPDFRRLVEEWALRRERDVRCGERPVEDLAQVNEARDLAERGEVWRRHNKGLWRR